MKTIFFPMPFIAIAIFSLFSCATSPKSIQGEISLPQKFEKVWYRDTLEKPGLAVMTDTGTLTVNNQSIIFSGKKENVCIKMKDIHALLLKNLEATSSITGSLFSMGI